MPSSSLIPDDPSVLFTTAGMQQFKAYFVGEKNPMKDFGSLNTVSIQKCLRTSDIDEVGDDTHLTFFEMLGNFSFGGPARLSFPKENFGGYFKKEAIKHAHEFLIKELGINIQRMDFTVFGGDDKISYDEESYDILKQLGIPEKQIKKCGREDNFWGPTGKEGPCGRTVEFYVDGVERWNLVFNEYYCRSNMTELSSPSSFEKLKTPGVDTGMGLERLTMILQNKNNIFETDLFAPIVAKVKSMPRTKTKFLARGQISPKDPDKSGPTGQANLKSTSQNLKINEDTIRIRIIADHIKASVFLLADGITFSNIGKGYILRRLIRRAVRYGKLLDFKKDFINESAGAVIEIYKNNYPELAKNKKNILLELKQEKEKFEKTLEEGLKILLKLFDRVELFNEESKKIETRDFGDYRGLGKEFFDIFSTYGFPFEMIIEEINDRKKDLGFERLSKIQEDEIKQEFNERFQKHQEISRAGVEKKFGGLRKNAGEKETELHTVTHLLHQVLREILGNEIRQMGSDITEERLRFDFSFGRKMTPDEIKKVENLVNQKIKEGLIVKAEEMSYEEAVKSGSLAFLKEKYPERVKVYLIGGFSREICAGPHAKNTSELGEFKIIKEESSSAGIRRIRAILAKL